MTGFASARRVARILRLVESNAISPSVGAREDSRAGVRPRSTPAFEKFDASFGSKPVDRQSKTEGVS